MAFYVTFYSFKGGVGRTSALVNAGWALAAAGHRVLLVDGDLEAPGFDEYDELGSGDHAGFLELAEAWAADATLPELGPYLHRAQRHNLHVLPAGRMNAAWASRVEAIDWTRLHPTGNTRFLRALRDRIETDLRPDYVLVDARTGFSEVAGLLTHQLADQVVLLFRQTRTSIRGTLLAFRSLCAGSAVGVIPVVSLVPSGQAAPGTLGARRIQRARELLDADSGAPVDLVRIDYDPAAMVAEGVAVRSPDQYPLANLGYRALVERISAANPADVGRALSRARELRASGRDGEGALREHVQRYSSASGRIALADLLVEAGKKDEALALYDAVLAEANEAPPPWRIRRAELAFAAGRVEDPGAWEEHLPKAPTHAEAAEARGLRMRHIALQFRAAAARGAGAAQRAELVRALDATGTRAGFVELFTLLPEDFDPGWLWDRMRGAASFTPEEQDALIGELALGTLPRDERETLVGMLKAETAAAFFREPNLTMQLEQSRRRPPPKDLEQQLALAADSAARLDAARAALGGRAWHRQPTPAALGSRRYEVVRSALAQVERAGWPALGAIGTSCVQQFLWFAAKDGSLPAEEARRRRIEVAEQGAGEESLDLISATNLVLSLCELLRTRPWDSDALLKRAEAALEQAARLDPASSDYLSARAAVARRKAEIHGGAEGLALLLAALEDERAARDASPGEPRRHNSVAMAALTARHHVLPVDGPALLDEAEAACHAANALSPGHADYNLACVASHRGDFDGAERLVRRTILDRIPPSEPPAHALADPDLAPLLAARPALRADLERAAASRPASETAE